MSIALLVIDAQNDYLATEGLQPHHDALCAEMARLLEAFRAAQLPIFHIWTTVRASDQRMPHWRALGIERCVAGTQGHLPPPELQPLAGEVVIHKQFYSGFVGGMLAEQLRRNGVSTVVCAGVHLRACVRTTAVDAYQHGFQVWIADDAVGDDDPVHAAVARQYLDGRVGRFRGIDQILSEPMFGPAGTARPAQSSGSDRETYTHVSPHNSDQVLWQVPLSRAASVTEAALSSQSALSGWGDVSAQARAALLQSIADRVEALSDELATQITLDTGTPILESRLEVGFGVNLIKAALASLPAEQPAVEGPGWRAFRKPLGVVALVSPWNNPLAIPLGKLAPALLHGNTVVWKPALPGTAIARSVMEILQNAGLPSGVVRLLPGDRVTAETLMAHRAIDAVTLTGSLAAGFSAQAICARRSIPFQGELGGNNAAIVWTDANLPHAAQLIAEGGLGSAGQRCTANRRVIVPVEIVDDFLEALVAAVRAMPWGDPRLETTKIGPVISATARRRISGTVARAAAQGCQVITPHLGRDDGNDLLSRGAYYPATLVVCDNRDAEIVQEETFGPVIVIQPASNWAHALALCNGVRQGLALALFSNSVDKQHEFLAQARAGILKINRSTAGAATDAPFGGWKGSGVGPPEHGPADAEFYARWQAIYAS